MKTKILQRIDERRDELVNLLRALMMVPSQSRQEKAVAELIAARLKEYGFSDAAVDDLYNAVCYIPGSGGGPTLMYNGHIDCVPVGDMSLWPVDPLQAPVEGNRVVGRGACDMKGSVAAMMLAAAAVKESGAPLRGNLILHMVAREEEGLQEGTRFAVEQSGLKADLAIIGEATNLGLFLGSRGRILVDVAVKGKAAHAANAANGINAIVKMGKMIEAIGEMRLPDHEILGPATQTITIIDCQPGQVNMVPSQCAVTIDRRIAPGASLEGVKAEFEAVIARMRQQDSEFEATVETRGYAPPGYLPPEEPVLNMLRQSAAGVLGQQPAVSRYIFGTDGSYLAKAGIPWFGFGPGNEADAHTVNDHVLIEDLVAASKVYASFILDYLS